MSQVMQDLTGKLGSTEKKVEQTCIFLLFSLVLEPAGLSPIFYSDPKEHSRTEKYTLIRNTINHRPHPTQKSPEHVCHVQTVKPNT